MTDHTKKISEVDGNDGSEKVRPDEFFCWGGFEGIVILTEPEAAQYRLGMLCVAIPAIVVAVIYAVIYSLQ
jgi:hypothetical protein